MFQQFSHPLCAAQRLRSYVSYQESYFTWQSSECHKSLRPKGALGGTLCPEYDKNFQAYTPKKPDITSENWSLPLFFRATNLAEPRPVLSLCHIALSKSQHNAQHDWQALLVRTAEFRRLQSFTNRETRAVTLKVMNT